jgi:hypothetical protein
MLLGLFINLRQGDCRLQATEELPPAPVRAADLRETIPNNIGAGPWFRIETVRIIP